MSDVSRDAVNQFLLACVQEMLDEAETVAAPVSETGLLTDSGFDSIHLINLIVQIEQQYGVFFEDEEMMSGRFQTVGDIAGLLLEKLGAAS